MDTTTRLSNTFLKNHPDDCARILEGLPTDKSAAFLTACDPAIAASVIQRVSPNIAAACLSFLSLDQSISVLLYLDIGEVALIAQHWEAEVKARTLDALPTRIANAIRKTLDYPPGSVGSLMDPMALTLPADITVDEAKQRIVAAGEKMLHGLYIVNREQELAGVVSLRDFVQASPESRLASMMNKQFIKLRAGVTLEQAAASAKVSKTLSFPIVDKKNAFLGVLSTKVLYEALGQSDSSRMKRDSVDTVVALGELYWVTLSGMLSGVQLPKNKDTSRSPSVEPSNGR